LDIDVYLEEGLILTLSVKKIHQGKYGYGHGYGWMPMHILRKRSVYLSRKEIKVYMDMDMVELAIDVYLEKYKRVSVQIRNKGIHGYGYE